MFFQKNFPLTTIIFIALFKLSTTTLMMSPSLEDTLKQCLVTHQPQSDLKRCMGIGALNRLQSLDENPEFDFVDGLTLFRDLTQEYRDNGYNYADLDPSNLRSIIDTFDHVFSKRAMRWDMSFIYPGLNMRIVPSVSPNGVLDFVIDPTHESGSVNRIHEIGTGRLLAKQFLVPFLLGFKFNVGSLLPIMFGVLVLIAKKAVFISKLALIVSSAFGLASLLFNNYAHNNQNPTDQYYHGATHYHPTTFGNPYKGFIQEYLPQDHLQYRGMDQSSTMDQLKLYGNLPDVFGDRSVEETQQKSSRNFAWSEDEKKKIMNSS